MSRGMHLGDVKVDRSGRFRDMVCGDLTIGSGVDVDMASMVNGTLIVERGATVRVSGMVNGGIDVRGGRVSVIGMVG